MTLFHFTRRKFLSLAKTQQQRKCAELVRHIYEETLNSNHCPEAILLYENLLHWLGERTCSYDLVSLSNRYHDHLQRAHLAIKEHNLLPPMRRGDKAATIPFGSLSIYLDNMRSAYNVGSILRTCEALRIGEVFFSEKTPFIDHDKVIKTAMGCASIVPCKKLTHLEELPRPWIVLDTCYEAVKVEEFLFPQKGTLILGNEEYGVSPALLEKSDFYVEIPMLGMKNSINVACAFGIAASKIAAQRNISSWEKQNA